MEDLLQVGVITSTHGVRGEVKVFPTTDDVRRFKRLKEVILDTVQGVLLLRGDELNVTRLLVEKGEVDLDGRIDSLVYTERSKGSKRSESFAKRLFG